jgi:hypothetical protein
MSAEEPGYRRIQRDAGEMLPATDEEALGNVLAAFPDAVVLPFEPLSAVAEADAALVEDDRPSSWRAVDLRQHLEADDGRDAPSLLVRTDGRGLLYRGKRNEAHGPYESGKSWLAGVGVVEVLRSSGVAVWLDWEDSPRSVVARLLALGATEAEILRGFRYLQPAEPLTAATEIDLRLELNGAAFVVIDAANESMAAAGWDPNQNRDVAQFYRTIPRLSTEAGATLLVLDHVAKDPGSQRGPVGAGHKAAAIDGASYRVDAVTPFGRGSVGLVRLRLTKDRPGYVRGLLGSGREPVAAEVSFDATNPASLVVEVRPPSGVEAETWRPTRLMEKISLHVEAASEPLSTSAILTGVPGKRDYKIAAIEELVRGGFFSRAPGPRNALLHVSERPFREEPA